MGVDTARMSACATSPRFLYWADFEEGACVFVARPGGPPYLPMQKVEKIRFRMSSAVVAPVIESMGRRAA